MLFPITHGGHVGLFEAFIGDTFSATGTNTPTFSNVALNETARAGDYIVAQVSMLNFSISGHDSTSDIAVTDFTAINETQWGVSDTTSGNHTILQKTASGGETTVTLATTVSGFSFTADHVYGRVYILRGLNSITPLDTQASSTGSASATLDTSGAKVVIGALAGTGQTTCALARSTSASANETSTNVVSDTDFVDLAGCCYVDLDLPASATETYTHSGSALTNERAFYMAFA